MRVKGIQSGTIHRVSSVMAQPSSDGQIIIKLPTERHETWITSTASLGDKNPSLVRANDEDLVVRDSIWETLTMGLLPKAMKSDVAALCFSKIWTAEGRGAMHNLALIEWIDKNAWLQYMGWTLREWSQMKSGSEFPGESHKSLQPSQIASHGILEEEKSDERIEQLNTFIDTLERVLKRGTRLSVISGLDTTGKDCIGMVHPCAMSQDQIWYIQGCSIPILMRALTSSHGDSLYKVIGAVHLHDSKKRFKAEERWIAGEIEDSTLLSTSMKAVQVIRLC
jgi:hypothetical protein